MSWTVLVGKSEEILFQAMLSSLKDIRLQLKPHEQGHSQEFREGGYSLYARMKILATPTYEMVEVQTVTEKAF